MKIELTREEMAKLGYVECACCKGSGWVDETESNPILYEQVIQERDELKLKLITQTESLVKCRRKRNKLKEDIKKLAEITKNIIEENK